jgi:hypothetical protein
VLLNLPQAEVFMFGDAVYALPRIAAHSMGPRGRSPAPVPPFSPALQRMHRALKTNFDPDAILNRGLVLGA